ncbi:hypothetical protein MKEN_00887600 [Mycena kentingensis (nom. inval.)]|nr:hypothetical protein MKEN_00887600 [Mycena kentingensis (nom. inval.)]
MSIVPPDLCPPTTLPTYRRLLSPNELSYFLPSRAYGLNDMCMRLILRAPPGPITLLRLQTVWAILRLRHPLMAARIEMAPGCYDAASFVYTPPASPRHALNEAALAVCLFHDMSGPELMQDALNGPRKLSAACLSRLEVTREECAPGMHEYHLGFLFVHSINDARGIYMVMHFALELLGQSPPLSDAQLFALLEAEWRERWSFPRNPKDVIIESTEVRIIGSSPVRRRFQEAAWKIDQNNVQRRFIGGHSFPRIKPVSARATNTRLIQAKFSKQQTEAMFARCKAERVTPQSAVFGLINLAWMRLLEAHPEIPSSEALPMLVYTAISLRAQLAPGPPLSSFMSLALGYHNIMLPVFGTRSSKLFWARSREAQRQMFAYSHSPMLLGRSVVASDERGVRARNWARIDDEEAGLLPRRPAPPKAKTSPPPPPKVPAVPPIALLGVSQSGTIDGIFRRERYPIFELLDVVGGTRKGPGTMLVYTRTFVERFNLLLHWDAGPFDDKLVAEEFWGYLINGLFDYALGNPSSKGTEERIDCCAPRTILSRARL